MIELPNEFGSARAARLWLAREIQSLDLTAKQQDDAALMVSELVTNVIVHTDSRPVVLARVERWQLVVEVADSSSSPPVVRKPDGPRPGGMGLLLVDQLADSWGTLYPAAGGKIVWFAVSRP